MKSLRKFTFMPAFHGIDNISGSLLPDPHHHSSQNASRVFPGNESAQRSKLLRIKSILLRWLHLFNATFHAKLPKAPGKKYAPARSTHFSEKKVNTKASDNSDIEWAPLVKADQPGNHEFSQKLAHQLNVTHRDLAGQAVLCVGGRAALYPDYLRLVETAGGCFLVYRSSLKDNRDHLYTLLNRVNMVICPVDCVSHDDYFAVKRYCKLTGKSCAFLARSNLPTFNQGLKILIHQFQENNRLE